MNTDQRHKSCSRSWTSEGWPHLYPEGRIRTLLGVAYWADSVNLMECGIKNESVDLIVTSPPFGLVRKKEYGNADADEYLEWFRPFAEQFARVLKQQGSLVIDIGGAWKSWVAVQKSVPIRTSDHSLQRVQLSFGAGVLLVEPIKTSDTSGMGHHKTHKS